MPVFWGKGRNGKGTMIKVLQSVMGRLAGSIQTELLLHSRLTRSSAGPSPDILDLRGLRMAFAAETDEGQRFSASKVKWLTGADQLVGRGLNEKVQVRFEPTHKIFLSTNDKPSVSGDDYAFWKRMHLIPFKLSYVVDKDPEDLEDFERVADPELEGKLKEEASGILAWLVRGCIDYQKQGLKPTQTVRDATLEYQQDEDLLGQFTDYYCRHVAGAKTKSSEIFDKFNEWWKEMVSSKGISQKRFGGMMKKRYDTSKIKGVVYYHGIVLDLNRVIEIGGED
jgi:putative DNA primase/helicase